MIPTITTHTVPMTSVVKQVRIEQPDESQGSNGGAVREMPHP
jgi:hypothetical protein